MWCLSQLQMHGTIISYTALFIQGYGLCPDSSRILAWSLKDGTTVQVCHNGGTSRAYGPFTLSWLRLARRRSSLYIGLSRPLSDLLKPTCPKFEASQVDWRFDVRRQQGIEARERHQSWEHLLRKSQTHLFKTSQPQYLLLLFTPKIIYNTSIRMAALCYHEDVQMFHCFLTDNRIQPSTSRHHS